MTRGPASSHPAPNLSAPGTPAPGPKDPRDALPDHLPALRAFAISLTRNPSTADDLVQDTIVKAWTRFDSFTQGTNLQAWLFTILRNTYFSALRKHRREVPDADGIHAQGLFVKPDHDGKLAFSDFQRAFDQLTPEHREVLILVGASGYTVEEAADLIGIAAGTVKSRTNRARKRLAELMGLDEGEDALPPGDTASLALMGQSGVQAA